MKKVRVLAPERVLGALLGILLALTFFLVGFVNVLKSQSFYLGQDKRYEITSRMSLKNADQFRDVYHSLQAAFAGNDDFQFTLYRRAPETADESFDPLWAPRAQGELLWSKSEEAFLRAAGDVFSAAGWIAACGFLPLIAWLIVRLRKRGRATLLGIGWYAVFASVVTAALLNVLPALLARTDLLSTLSDGLWLRVVFSENTQRDLISGVQWFYDFLMLIPLGIAAALIRISEKKDNDPNEDYLYQ